MVDVYFKLIREGLRTLESIRDPELRALVKEKLEEADSKD